MSIAKPEPGRRPVEYRPEIGSTILDRLDKFETLRDICADPAMPDKATVLRWVAQHAEFRDEYAVTPRLQAEALMEETTYIIDDALSGCLGSVRGGKVVSWPLRARTRSSAQRDPRVRRPARACSQADNHPAGRALVH
jgi:hypothetical protein